MELYNGTIIDPVHGLIRLSDIEKWFMSQKQFSRLRWIRQNTFVYYVFPSANHTRFEHSIGVMHLASEIFKNLISNHKSGNYRRQKHNISLNKRDFDFLDIDEVYLIDSDKEKKYIHLQELRLAALLHDIGHGPLSHKFDSYTLTKSEFISIINTDDLAKEYLSSFENLLVGLADSDRIEHEHVSCLFILQLVATLKLENVEKENKFFGDLGKMIKLISGERIVRLIEPRFDFGEEGKMLVNGMDLSPLYSTIISSFPLDADRMDYLLRDGMFTGVKYGVYDLSRLFTSLIPITIEYIGHLAIKESGVDACVRFIESRTHLFNIVYPHKTNIAANSMLDYIFDEYQSSIVEAKTYEELTNFYWVNSDENFIRNTILDKVINSNINEDIKVKKSKVHEQLLRRRLWKKIFEFRFSISTDTTDLEEKCKKKLHKLREIVDEINLKVKNSLDINCRANLFVNNVFKDYDKSKLYIVKKDKDGYKLIKSWKGFNPEVKAMDYKVGFFKIFIERKFNSSPDFLKIQSEVLELINMEIDNFKCFAGEDS